MAAGYGDRTFTWKNWALVGAPDLGMFTSKAAW
jgi:hypothetical protein